RPRPTLVEHGKKVLRLGLQNEEEAIKEDERELPDAIELILARLLGQLVPFVLEEAVDDDAHGLVGLVAQDVANLPRLGLALPSQRIEVAGRHRGEAEKPIEERERLAVVVCNLATAQAFEKGDEVEAKVREGIGRSRPHEAPRPSIRQDAPTLSTLAKVVV